MAWIDDPELRVGEAVEDAAAAVGLDPRDRGLARELVAAALRGQRFHDHVLGGLLDRGLPERPELLAALRLGAVQLLDLDRIPPHAAVAETVACLPPQRRGLVNAVLRRLAGLVKPATADDRSDPQRVPLGDGSRILHCPSPLPDADRDPVGRAALIAGIPEWMATRWAEQHGVAVAVELCAAAGRVPGTHLRAVRRDRQELLAELLAAGVDVVAHAEHPRMLHWRGGAPSPFRTDNWRRGELLVQDPTAVRAAEAVDAQPGERILDLCAAPGTKAALLAEQVGAAGQVLGHDIDGGRLQRVRENAERLGLTSLVATTALTAEHTGFDRALVDVPCSNTGVLARRVELRHTLEPARITELATLQGELLDQAVERVRPGGLVVYSTCSIEAEENQAVVAAACARRADLELLHEVATLPAPPSHDGGYFAVLRRAPAGPLTS